MKTSVPKIKKVSISKDSKKDELLRRYTDLSSLIHILETSNITFLNPANWDDKNDSNFIELYKKQKKIKSLLALCFTETTETYHHWKIFAKDSNGVCIKFKKDELLEQLKNSNQASQISHTKIEYLTLEKAEKFVKVEKMPFTKRRGFKDEAEFRIIFESDDSINYQNIQIDLSCIESIVFNPWLPEAMIQSIANMLSLKPEVDKITFSKSSLTNNDTWFNIGKNTIHSSPSP